MIGLSQISQEITVEKSVLFQHRGEVSVSVREALDHIQYCCVKLSAILCLGLWEVNNLLHQFLRHQSSAQEESDSCCRLSGQSLYHLRGTPDQDLVAIGGSGLFMVCTCVYVCVCVSTCTNHSFT